MRGEHRDLFKTEAKAESSKMKLFAKIFYGLKALTIFKESSN